MKKTIGRKINHLLAISLIVLSFFMISLNLIVVYRSVLNNSHIMMSKTCSSLTLQLDNRFDLIEQAVQNLYDISEQIRPDVNELKKHRIANEFIEKFKEIALVIANNTDGALAIYYRMNPDITLKGTSGFFYVKTSATGEFEKSEITDLYKYDVDDVEHVGWYYIPVWEGKAVWMEPYYNANIDVEMISYVVPIYDRDALIGVVGMDVDFNAIKSIAENIDIYESSGAVLCSLSNNQIYFNQSDLFGSDIPDELYKMLQGSEASQKIINYIVDHEQYGIFYETLNNRMKLLIYAKESEIFSQWSTSALSSLVVFVLIFTITLFVSIRLGSGIVKPISDITEASKKYAQGDWDVKVYCNTEDELQVLTENIMVMAEKTRDYISYIQEMARKDGLTGLRNKSDYLFYMETLDKEFIQKGKEFAVIVFDVNNLKTVNDKYGHEKGDELLVSASKFICNHFSHSPVFRIGGDEFVAILNGRDYEKCEELLDSFRQYMRFSRNSDNIMDVCISSGMAQFREDGESYEVIFRTADQRMYENKKELKGGQAPR